MPYNEAKELMQSLKITSEKEFEKYMAKGDFPSNIPNHPSLIYSRKGWINWKTFLEK